MTGHRRKCSECDRFLLEEGPRKRVEAAWDRNREAQAVVFQRDLGLGRFRRRNEQRLAALAIRLEDYCNTGKLQIPRELNQLNDALWEIKAGDLRLPFFDVPNTRSGSVRATHGFIKNSKMTPRIHISKAVGIMREDLLNDSL
jgi:hypothetical protein